MPQIQDSIVISLNSYACDYVQISSITPIMNMIWTTMLKYQYA